MLKAKKQVKVLFKVNIKGVQGLPIEFEGKEVRIAWKRGKKRAHNGKSKKAQVSKGAASVSASTQFNCTLHQDGENGKFSKKKLTVSLVLVTCISFSLSPPPPKIFEEETLMVG